MTAAHGPLTRRSRDLIGDRSRIDRPGAAERCRRERSITRTNASS